MKKLWAWFKLEFNWLSVPDNRVKLYNSMKVIAPILIAIGIFTPDQTAKWLELLGPVLLFGSATVAKRNVK